MEILHPKRKRKSPKEYREEHDLFLLFMQERKPTLEIMGELQLTPVQFKRHLLDALTLNEISAYQPEYEAIKAGSLPESICKKLRVPPEALVKIQEHEGGVLLSRLSTAPEGV